MPRYAQPSFPDNPFIRPRGQSCPIQKLPFELLARLFEFGAIHTRPLNELYTARRCGLLEEASGEEGMSKDIITRLATGTGSPFPLAVSHVCHHWRDIALSTPSLWKYLRIPTETSRLPYKLLSLYLERSKPLPIDIFIHDQPANQESGHTPASFDAASLYALLTPHFNRWRSIELRCKQPLRISAFLDAVANPSSPSQLESIKLYDFYELLAQHRTITLSDLRTFLSDSSPQLKHLFLFGVDFEWNQLISAASNLTVLELFWNLPPFWTEFVALFRSASRLQKLTLYQLAPFEPPETWVLEPSATGAALDIDSRIPLLQLTELVLGSQPANVSHALARSFYLPALKSLILDLCDGDHGDFVDELAKPLPSLTPHTDDEDAAPSLLMHLERVAILGLACWSDEVLDDMFDQLENVTMLRLQTPEDSNIEYGTTFLLELLLPATWNRPVTCALPRLESLFVCPSRVHLPLLRQVVETRRRAGFPLKSLYLSVDNRMSKQDIVWFDRMLETFGFTDEVQCWNTESAFEGPW